MEGDEGLLRRLGRASERTCRLSQNPRALQCSLQPQRKHPARLLGQDPKETIQVAPGRKEIIYDGLPCPGAGKLEFRMEEGDALLCSSAWEIRLNELADYHQIHGHCNVP